MFVIDLILIRFFVTEFNNIGNLYYPVDPWANQISGLELSQEFKVGIATDASLFGKGIVTSGRTLFGPRTGLFN